MARALPLLALVAAALLGLAQAFLPATPLTRGATSPLVSNTRTASSLLTQQRQALPLVARPQPQLQQGVRGQPLYGIFGLGTPELVVIALVAGIVLGPDKIVDLARGVGKAAGELKAVPQEFEKGLKSGEEAAIKTKQELAKQKEGAADKKDE